MAPFLLAKPVALSRFRDAAAYSVNPFVFRTVSAMMAAMPPHPRIPTRIRAMLSSILRLLPLSVTQALFVSLRTALGLVRRVLFTAFR